MALVKPESCGSAEQDSEGQVIKQGFDLGRGGIARGIVPAAPGRHHEPRRYLRREEVAGHLRVAACVVAERLLIGAQPSGPWS